MCTPFSQHPATGGLDIPAPSRQNPGPFYLVFTLLQLHSGGSLAPDCQELSVSLPGMLALDVATDLVPSTPAPPHSIPITVLLGRFSLPYFGRRVKGQYALPVISSSPMASNIIYTKGSPIFLLNLTFLLDSKLLYLNAVLVPGSVEHLEGSESQKEIC